MTTEIAKIINNMTGDDDYGSDFDSGWDAATYEFAERLADLFETLDGGFCRENWFVMCGINSM